jgi:hypothetical protein
MYGIDTIPDDWPKPFLECLFSTHGQDFCCSSSEYLVCLEKNEISSAALLRYKALSAET